MGLVSNANAQQGGNFAIKGGLNLATLVGDDVEDVDARTSFHVGGAFELKLSEAFSLQPEFLYSSQGIKDGDTQLKLGYANIPFMAKYYVAKGFSIQAGPQVGFLLTADAEGELFGVEFSGDVSEFYKKVDVGANLGLGYRLPMGLFFDFRYNIGFTTIDEC